MAKLEIAVLEDKAFELRCKLLMLTGKIGGSHLGGSLSMMDIMAALYHRIMNIDPAKPAKDDRDIFILSKGHAGVCLCVVLGDRGFFPESELHHFNQTGSYFGIHPDRKRIAGVEASTGSLGHGLGLGVGIALAKKIDRRQEQVFVLLSDGELHEGSNWEAIMSAAHFKLGNLTAIIDYNRMSQDGPIAEIMGIDPLADKFKSFGWRVLEVDGHDMKQIVSTFESLPHGPDANQGQPTCIIAHTVKGKGIAFMENSVGWHYGGLDTETETKALTSLYKAYNRKMPEAVS